jgi:hypothetical protein
MAYFTIASLKPRISSLLQGRNLVDSDLLNYTQDTVLELSEDYKFPGLQTSGPVVSLIPLQAVYPPSFFTSTLDGNIEVNKIDSFFLYTNGYTALTSATEQNTGFQLGFKTINDLEVLINVPGMPTNWTRHEGNIWIGCVPDQNYQCYARYIHENPFPLDSDLDTIFFPNTWKDILSYCIAMRAARDLNLGSKANELFSALYGSSKFIISGGQEGTPGLIFQRTSQERRDQTTTTKSMRLRMPRAC